MSAVASVLGYVTLPVVTASGGSVVAAWRSPGPWTRSAVQHIAGGLIFAAASLELLPDLVREHNDAGIVIGFTLGIAAMLGLRQFGDRVEARGDGSGAAVAVVSLIATDVFLDGLLMGIAFSETARQGRILTIALTVELAFLGLTVAAALQGAGADRRRVILTTIAIALVLPVGAVLGAGPLGALRGIPFSVILAFGTVALLYLVTEELLTEAHESTDTPVLTALFFVGFLALLLVSISSGGST